MYNTKLNRLKSYICTVKSCCKIDAKLVHFSCKVGANLMRFADIFTAIFCQDIDPIFLHASVKTNALNMREIKAYENTE